MSWRATTWAKQVKTGSASLKALLLILADYADENGSCFPSQALLAEETEQSVRTVRRQLEFFEEEGWVKRERRSNETGHRTSDRYYLQIPTGQFVRLTTGQIERPTGQKASSLPDTAMAEEPLEEPLSRTTKGGKAPKRPETPLPEGWEPLPRHGEFVQTHGLTLAFEAQQFKNNALAKDLRYVLWDRAFDTWLGKSAKWNGGNVTPIRKPARRDTPPAPDRESLPW